jgi:carboxymethylenebutenolidase
VLSLFDQYVHGLIDRRAFLVRAAKFAVGSMTASMLLDALNPRFAEAQQVARDDSRLEASTVELDSPKGSGKVRGYLALPAKAQGKLPGILVVHENRGLNPHIEDIRIALESYVAFAPDALTPLGGYPGDEDKARELPARVEEPRASGSRISRRSPGGRAGGIGVSTAATAASSAPGVTDLGAP